MVKIVWAIVARKEFAIGVGKGECVAGWDMKAMDVMVKWVRRRMFTPALEDATEVSWHYQRRAGEVSKPLV